MPEFIDVDPGELHLPPSRSQGADPGKLARQIAKYGFRRWNTAIAGFAMKSEPDRELLAVITALRQRYPNWRFGQLIVNVADWADREIWDVDDEQLLEAARLHLEQPPSRNQRPAAPDAALHISPRSAVPRA